MTGLRVADFDFDLPPELIAQQPPAERGASRMLAMDRATGALRDMTFAELPSLLNPGDLLVLNETRVIPARLYARRAASAISPVPASPQMLGAPSLRLFSGARVGNHDSQSASIQQQLGAPGLALETWDTTIRNRHSAQQQPAGRIEVLLTEPAGENLWRALVRPGRKVAIGERLLFPAPSGEIALEAEVLERGEFGERLLRFEPVADFFAVLDRIGHVPLPPYIRRGDATADRERYQTVFAREPGSVAAPTAGLHFTPPVLDALAARGVEVARITLHVGLGTFAPLRVERLDEVRLHRERYTLSAAAADAVNRARREGRRIVAVGTTVVRTLEAAAAAAEKRRITDEICERHPSGPKGPVDFAGSKRGLKPPPPSESSLSAACLAGGGTVLTASGLLQPHSGETEIFISPSFEFRLVGALLTNFHLPQSSLLMLVSAFAGREPVLAAYAHAVREKYRFFSYGDCMFLA
ncbi:MAG: S-adenosylmethionine:tRNA ribosyltransferase-isomerase [Terracidiphilus sp.]|jgi:S-adenosylmethionine:tRNA ribosyltransferase-isomerase